MAIYQLSAIAEINYWLIGVGQNGEYKWYFYYQKPLCHFDRCEHSISLRRHKTDQALLCVLQALLVSCLAVFIALPVWCLYPLIGTFSSWTKRPGTITLICMDSSASSSRLWTPTDTGKTTLPIQWPQKLFRHLAHTHKKMHYTTKHQSKSHLFEQKNSTSALY